MWNVLTTHIIKYLFTLYTYRGIFFLEKIYTSITVPQKLNTWSINLIFLNVNNTNSLFLMKFRVNLIK